MPKQKQFTQTDFEELIRQRWRNDNPGVALKLIGWNRKVNEEIEDKQKQEQKKLKQHQLKEEELKEKASMHLEVSKQSTKEEVLKHKREPRKRKHKECPQNQQKRKRWHFSCKKLLMMIIMLPGLFIAFKLIEYLLSSEEKIDCNVRAIDIAASTFESHQEQFQLKFPSSKVSVKYSNCEEMEIGYLQRDCAEFTVTFSDFKKFAYEWYKSFSSYLDSEKVNNYLKLDYDIIKRVSHYLKSDCDLVKRAPHWVDCIDLGPEIKCKITIDR